MSISKFQEKLFHKGCGTAILIFCAAVFGAFAFSNWGRSGGDDRETDSQGKATKTVASIGDIKITSSEIDGIVSQQQDSPQAGDSTSPVALATQYGQVMDTLTQHAALAAIAKSDGIQFTDNDIHNAIKDQAQRGAQSQKMSLIAQGKLKPGATDADMEAYLKKSGQPTPSEQLAQTITQIDSALKDPAQRQAMVDQIMGPVVLSFTASKINPTDAELKANYNQYTLKRILIQEKPAPSPSVAARVADIQKDLKSGAKFESAMNRYSDETPKPKQKIADNVTLYNQAQLETDKTLTPLAKLKVGEVSDPIATPEGTSIYDLVAIKNNAPKDFDKNIAQYKSDYQSSHAKTMLVDQINTMIASNTKWEAPGYQALYDATQPTAAANPKALFDEAKSAVAKEGFDMREAEIAEYITFDMLWTAPGADQVKLRPQRIEVLTDYLRNMENFGVRMQLVQMFEADKNGKSAVESLVEAARANNSYDKVGQQNFGDVEGALIRLKLAGMVTPDQEKEILSVQAEWKKEHDDYVKNQAAQAAEQAKAQAEEEADRKKAEAAQKAALKNGPAVKVKPSSTSGTPAPGSAATDPSFKIAPTSQTPKPGGKG